MHLWTGAPAQVHLEATAEQALIEAALLQHLFLELVR